MGVPNQRFHDLRHSNAYYVDSSGRCRRYIPPLRVPSQKSRSKEAEGKKTKTAIGRNELRLKPWTMEMIQMAKPCKDYRLERIARQHLYDNVKKETCCYVMCIDNDPMEGFWVILKRERYYGRWFLSHEELVQIYCAYSGIFCSWFWGKPPPRKG